MRIRDRVYWIGSGLLGTNATHELDCNVYLLDGGHEKAIIDCGTGYGIRSIIAEMNRDGFAVEDVHYLFLTHAHADHAGGAAVMKKRTGALAAASKKTAVIVESGDEQAMGLTGAMADGVYPADYVFKPCEIEVTGEGGSLFQVGELTLELIETPGHSADMVAYYCPELRTLFSGDTVFHGGSIAAITTEDFSLAALAASIDKLHALNIDSLMPGHFTPIVRGGHVPIAQAKEYFRMNKTPPSIV